MQIRTISGCLVTHTFVCGAYSSSVSHGQNKLVFLHLAVVSDVSIHLCYDKVSVIVDTLACLDG